MNDLPTKNKVRINASKQNQVKIFSTDANLHTKNKEKIGLTKLERTN